MKILTNLGVVLLTGLAGCATHYKPELTGTPHANVRMVSTLNKSGWAAVLKESCLPQTTFGWDSATLMIGSVAARETPRRVSIGMPLPTIPSNASFVETNIPVGKPIALGFSTIAPLFHLMACGSGVIFTPVEGTNYQITYQPTSGGNCSTEVQIIRKSESGEIYLESVVDVIPAPKCNVQASGSPNS